MAKKPSRKTTVSLKSKPVSFRLDRSLVASIQSVAETLGIARNKLVALVLAEYIVERNAAELSRLVKEEPTDGAIDLFA